MTIRFFARSLAAALLTSGLVGAPLHAADEPPPATDPKEPAAKVEASTPQPAPAPTLPLAVPVMPTTVVTPAGVDNEPAPSDKNRAAPTATTASPKAASREVKPTTRAEHPPSPSRFPLDRRTLELGRPAKPESRWHGFPISLSLRDAPLPEVLRSFARLAGMNLVLDPKVQGTVTVELHDVPWDQALYVILKTHGLAAEIDGQVWLVEPR